GPAALFLGRPPVPKRQEHPAESSQPENQNAHNLAVEHYHFARYQFETVEDRQEIPFRTDARRRWSKWIRLRPQLPREQRGQGSQNSERAIPRHQFPDNEVREERHGWRRRLEPRRRTHSPFLYQKQVEREQQRGEAGQ